MESVNNLADSRLLDTKGLAKALGVSPFTVDLWRRKEAMPVVKVGGRYYFRLEAVLSWLKARETAGAADDEPGEEGVIRRIRQ